jgi:MFS family permease
MRPALASISVKVRHTFAALSVPNYRRFFIGQAISLSGTWMQRIAQSWLVLELTGSPAAVGITIGLQTLPILLLAPFGGLVADRFDKRRLIILLQYLMAALAVGLAGLTLTGFVQLWHVYAIAFLLGIASTFENPARQSFIVEMVGPEDLPNAVGLNSVLVNLARIAGPAAAGFIIAFGGTGVCFLLNALTFIAVIGLLHALDVHTLQSAPPAQRARGQLRAGLTYVRRSAELGAPLLMMLLIGSLAYVFEVVLPLLATDAFSAGPETYGLMTAALGVGAVVGGLNTAFRRQTGLRSLIIYAAAFGVALLLAAAAPTMALELVALALVGSAAISFVSTCNSTVQLAAPAGARGRIMSLWQVAFIGSRSIGGPVVGAVTGLAGPRSALVLGAVVCFAAAAVGLWFVRRAPRTELAAGALPA